MSLPIGALRRLLHVSAITAIFSAAALGQPPSVQTESVKRMQEAVDRQKASVASQVGGAATGGFFTTPWSGPAPAAPALASRLPALPLPAAPPCVRLSEDDAAPLIAAVSTRSQLDPTLLREVIRQESGFLPCAVSVKGAMGLMQLMPDTAARFRVADPFDAGQSIAAGAQYLKELLDRFGGDVKLALAAYNAGPETVDKVKPALPNIPETRGYVDAIVRAVAAAGR